MRVKGAVHSTAQECLWQGKGIDGASDRNGRNPVTSERACRQRRRVHKPSNKAANRSKALQCLRTKRRRHWLLAL